MRPLAAALALVALSPAPALAWDAVRGDGDVATEARPLSGFTRVELRGSLDVAVAEGRPFAVSVTIDRNLLPLVSTRVEGDRLVIELTRPASHRGVGRVEVSLPELRGLSISGSGDATISGASLPRSVALAIDGSGDIAWSGRAGALTASIAGSGDMELTGEAESLTASIRGSGDIGARRLTARGATVAVEGSGDVEVTLGGGPLSASVAGSGDVTWWGQASPVAVSRAGSGEIRHRE